MRHPFGVIHAFVSAAFCRSCLTEHTFAASWAKWLCNFSIGGNQITNVAARRAGEEDSCLPQLGQTSLSHATGCQQTLQAASEDRSYLYKAMQNTAAP